MQLGVHPASHVGDSWECMIAVTVSDSVLAGITSWQLTREELNTFVAEVVATGIH